MRRFEYITLAWRALRGSLLRSALTMIIIALGIAAIVGIMTSIGVIRSSFVSNFMDLGASSFTITRERTDFGMATRQPLITAYQSERFLESYSFPARLGRSVEVSDQARITYASEETNPNVQVTAIDGEYMTIYGRALLAGRSFSEAEFSSGSKVVMLGYDVMESLNLSPQSAIGESVQVDGQSYLVVGVLAPKGSSSGQPDNLVFCPYQTALLFLPTANKNTEIVVEPKQAEDVALALAEARGVFRAIRSIPPGEPDDFELQKSDQLYNELMGRLQFIQIGTLVIGFLTLFSAGIGLMNIMLVAVGERTREIGLAKALGATSSDVQRQFLIEALLICTVGGVVGLLAGLLLGNVTALLLSGHFVIPWGWLSGGLLFSLLIGLAAGLYPAIKAGRLHPVEALRYE